MRNAGHVGVTGSPTEFLPDVADAADRYAAFVFSVSFASRNRAGEEWESLLSFFLLVFNIVPDRCHTLLVARVRMLIATFLHGGDFLPLKTHHLHIKVHQPEPAHPGFHQGMDDSTVAIRALGLAHRSLLHIVLYRRSKKRVFY